MKTISRLFIFICVLSGAYLIYFNKTNLPTEEVISNQKAAELKTFLEKYKKPQRVEVTSLTQRFADDAEEIKKLHLPLDSNSKYYITITLFTDETDSQAPLVAQIKFMDIATENKLSEENINLE